MPIYTDQDIANFLIRKNSPLSKAEIVALWIEADSKNVFKQEMREGDRYYNNLHDVLTKDFTRWIDENNQPQYQENKANNKIPHGHHRRLVIEKIAYLLKNPFEITHKIKELKDRFIEVLGKRFHSIVSEWATCASNKGKEFIHVFIESDPRFEDNRGKFSYMVMDAIFIIPIYDTARQHTLTQLMRYYPISVNVSGKEQERLRVEWWTEKDYEVYDQDKEGNFFFKETKPHFTITSPNGKKTDGSWGRIPFVELRNNVNAISDLRFVKASIDALDNVDSEFANDLEDLQEALLKAMGVSDDPSTIRRNYKDFKVVTTADKDGDFGFLTMDIPHEAKINFMRNTEENIATFGMGINPKTDRFGGNPSGIALKWLYSALDLKASMLEMQLIFALYELFFFVNKYFELTKKAVAKNVEEFGFKFVKTFIANEVEASTLANGSVGKISEETRLENDPRVKDVKAEIEALKKDRKELRFR